MLNRTVYVSMFPYNTSGETEYVVSSAIHIFVPLSVMSSLLKLLKSTQYTLVQEH